MKKHFLMSCLLGFLLVLGGCAKGLSGETYSRDQARTPQVVRMGTVESVRLVQIEGTKTPIGSVAGAAVGGIAGSGVGGGRGSMIAGVIGAVAGGLAGSAAEEGLTRSQGVEITVTEDGGQTRSYVQAISDNVTFAPGDRVRVLTVNGESRVTK
ncbi:MAG TPA: glycine zipper 2TM domain-containing protein [Pseudomonas xinjiangensis]|uniref:Glycine zipper 2TM domain-containing protein n=2 Tax=root TaxID=1 RepID=A0A7V1BP02_9GAMM|nr:glycine zipper 2TM domain-containing protein [Halopseudomonas xinjiangensis]HEC46293.1 glycine zipper 2TM domain-containing protein [Halopseudomonas xinjiangensis]